MMNDQCAADVTKKLLAVRQSFAVLLQVVRQRLDTVKRLRRFCPKFRRRTEDVRWTFHAAGWSGS